MRSRPTADPNHEKHTLPGAADPAGGLRGAEPPDSSRHLRVSAGASATSHRNEIIFPKIYRPRQRGQPSLFVLREENEVLF